MTDRSTLLVVSFVAAATVVVVAGCRRGHHHGPSTNTNPSTLFVEIHADGSHDDALVAGAAAGLRQVRFARQVDGGGELELAVEVARLETRGRETACAVKVLALRLPQHDLLGIADASARASGTDDDAAADCIMQVTSALVRGKVRKLLQRRLAAKR